MRAAVFGAMLVLSVAPIAIPGQDRGIGVDEVYPPEMFKEYGGRIVDVKKLKEAGIHATSAAGDGVKDDSEPLVAAVNWVIDQLKAHYASGGGVHWTRHWMIYLPEGTYRVTRPIMYSGSRVVDPIFESNVEREGTQRLMLVGQSRERTIIKLDNNAPGFGSGQKKPVVSFSRFDLGTVFNNMPSGNQCRNLTINTGTGNPGAIALDFYGANTARMDNIRIAGDGQIGVHIRIGSAHGYYSNVIVEGMDYGVYIEGNEESHPVFEYITLQNQKTAAIYLKGLSASFRKVSSTNSVTGVHMVLNATKKPHLTIVDSRFTGGLQAASFARLDAGFLFARNIVVQGYGSSVTKGNTVAVRGDIHEYVSESPTIFSEARVRQGPAKSMNLPLREYPLVPWIGDFSQWAVVDQFPGSNDAEKIQNAMNSGKKVVCFPRNEYTPSATVTVPASVEQVVGAQSRIDAGGTVFSIAAASAKTLLISGLDITTGQIGQSAQRDLLLESTSSGSNLYDSNLPVKGSTIHVLNAHGFARTSDRTTNITAYVRWNNNEKADHWQFTTDPGCTMVMLGFKSEKTFSVFRCRKGSNLEVLGGILNRFGSDASPDPVGISIEDANVSMTMASNGPDRDWNPMVQDLQSGMTKSWPMSDFADRGWTGNIVIPLYASYDTSLTYAVNARRPAPGQICTAPAEKGAVRTLDGKTVWPAVQRSSRLKVPRHATALEVKSSDLSKRSQVNLH